MGAVLGYGLLQFMFGQVVHIFVWRWFAPRAYPIWLPIIFGISPFMLLLILHFPFFSQSLAIQCDRNFYVLYGVSSIMHFALAAMYIHLFPAIVFFSPSLELIKLLAENKNRGLEKTELNLPVLSEGYTIDMRLNNLVSGGLIVENNSYYSLTPKGQYTAQFIWLYRRALGLPALGQG